MKVSKQLEDALNLLRERVDSDIKDDKMRDSIHWLIDAHEESKELIYLLRSKLSNVYGLLERISKHPEFQKIMEETKNDGKA